MKYTVFKRAATQFEEFARVKKTIVRKGLTIAEARSFCVRENAELTEAEEQRGLRYEFVNEGSP